MTQDEVLFVLTDDCIMGHTTTAFSRAAAAVRVSLLDDAMVRAGVQRKPEKDATAEPALTGMGCWLSGDPPRAEPDAKSIRRCVLAS